MSARKPSLWTRLRAWCWGLLALVIPDKWLRGIVRRKLRAFEANVGGVLTDKLAELLLFAMELAFIFWESYRRNLEGFRAQYVLRTADGRVAASAVFEPGRMWVKTFAVPSPTVTVTFKDPAAFRRFLSSKDHDIVQSLLANEVEVDGNLNQVYKLGYMARVLLSKFGIA
jgi:hypothetical protein